jgi:hypothetical protein
MDLSSSRSVYRNNVGSGAGGAPQLRSGAQYISALYRLGRTIFDFRACFGGIRQRHCVVPMIAFDMVQGYPEQWGAATGHAARACFIAKI